MYDHLYLPADTHIVFNNEDPRLAKLSEITYKLPDPPDPKLIHGYGLPPEEQYWKPFPMPKKLKALQDRQDLTDHQKISIVHENPEFYANEIEFIRKLWDWRENGFWIYIGGIKQDGKMYSKPYYFTGDLFFYLQAWVDDAEKPCKFRMREYKWFLFWHMVDNDWNCTGFNYPKYRREFATTKVSCIRYNTASRFPNIGVGLQSKDADHAKEVHELQIMKVWDVLPFFWRPVWDGNKQNKTSINFYPPTGSSHPDYGVKALKSFIDFKDSGENAYDGTIRKIIHNDEIAKNKLSNVVKRIEIQVPVLMKDGKIVGKLINTSTVNEMTKEGGANFKKICDVSHYKDRPANNRTQYGLYNFFMPARNGFALDKEQAKEICKQLGLPLSRAEDMPNKYGFCDEVITAQYLQNKKDGLLKSGNIDAWIEECRLFPETWADCWKASAKSNNFNVKIIEERLNELNDLNDVGIRVGNFVWKDGVQDSKVVWEDSPNGKFRVSFLFDTPEHSNKFYMSDGVRMPGNSNLFVAGGDPFKFRVTKSGRKSKGGGAVFALRNSAIDGDKKDVNEWKTHRFTCTYSHRPATKDIYGEDILMMCIYFGCEMNTETNVPLLWDHFERRGYSGYLFFNINSVTQRTEKTPGQSTNVSVIEEIFREYQQYIAIHGMREQHREILEECREIEDDMGDFDLFAAGGYALIAAKRRTINPSIQFITEEMESETYFEEYDI